VIGFYLPISINDCIPIYTLDNAEKLGKQMLKHKFPVEKAKVAQEMFL
jgi:hypothetical protein